MQVSAKSETCGLFIDYIYMGALELHQDSVKGIQMNSAVARTLRTGLGRFLPQHKLELQ